MEKIEDVIFYNLNVLTKNLLNFAKMKIQEVVYLLILGLALVNLIG